MVPFYYRLRDYGKNVALLDEHDNALTYDALHEAASTFFDGLALARPLIFLEAANTPSAVIAYVACLIHAYPVFLFQRQDQSLFARLLETYNPNIIIHADEDLARIEVRHDDLIAMSSELRILLSTSGSTGSPKLVKLSERNITSNAESICEYLEMTAQDRALTTLRFNYSYGMSVINASLNCGASILLSDTAVIDDRFWELFERYSCTNFAGVPYTFEMLERTVDRLGSLSTLRFATQAGGRLRPELVEKFAVLSAHQGWRFYVMYGQTEASPRMAYLPHHSAARYPSAIGVAIPGGTIEIVDAQGDLIAGQTDSGELRYRGPNIMLGYAQSTNDLAQDDPPKFLLTGDIARYNDAGLVEIVGRSTRFVKPYGLRINLDDLEAEVSGFVANAAVTGTDEDIYICLTSTTSKRDLVEHMAAKFKLPARIFTIVDVAEIPRLPSGKVDYKAIVELGKEASGTSPVVTVAGASATSGEFILSRNQVITLLLSGLWHGAAWTFVFWGFLHGMLLVAQRQIGGRVRKFYPQTGAIAQASLLAQMIFVFCAVAFTRIFFRSADLTSARAVIANITHGPYHWGSLDSKASLGVGIAVIIGVLTVEAGAEKGFWRKVFRRRRALRCASVLTVFLLTLLLGDFEGGRFVYVRF